MKHTATRALGFVVVMTILCGFIYTLVCTGVNQLLFPHQANGSVIEIDGKTYETVFVLESVKFDPLAANV